MSTEQKLAKSKLLDDWRVIQDALDTAADVMLPDPLYGPMLSKADTAMRHIRAALRTFTEGTSE